MAGSTPIKSPDPKKCKTTEQDEGSSSPGGESSKSGSSVAVTPRDLTPEFEAAEMAVATPAKPASAVDGIMVFCLQSEFFEFHSNLILGGVELQRQHIN